MGNSASSSGRGHHEETVDFGHLAPQGVYTGSQDWNQTIVSQLICARRLAPFYRPLEEYDDTWDDDQILAARKEPPPPDNDTTETITRIETMSSSNISARSSHNKRPGALKEPSKPEAAVYRGAVECPICFLYYPPNINHSRCCDQAICTECFVQIKRIEPTTTHLVSEPAACPYCVQDNFGIVYKPPPWRSGIGSDTSSFWGDPPRNSHQSTDPPAPYPTHKRRQKSYGAESPEVVLIDHIRPDWEAKLAAVRAAVARRANRRIIMRQVGDRLIPVGVTSGRVHALSPEEVQAEGVDNGGSRRSRRRQQPNQNQNFEQFMGMAGQDLEELMLMEAMRLSMIDHEEHQRKEAEERKKQVAAIAQSEAESWSTARPSTSEFSSESINQSYSPSSSSSPVSIPQTHPGEFLSVPGYTSSSSSSSSFSRTRTRTPSPSPISGSPPTSTPSSWNHRTPSPAPSNTLTATMSAVSTASAILASDPPADTNGTPLNGVADTRGTNLSSTPSMPCDQHKHSQRSGSPVPREQIPSEPQFTASIP